MTTVANVRATTAMSLLPPTGGSAPTEHEQEQLEAIYAILDRSQSARHVSGYLRTHPEVVRVWDDAAYDAAFPGSGASFVPARQELNLPRRILERAERGATTVAHEGQHALDAPSRLALVGHGFANVGGSILDGLGAAAHLHNPITGIVDGYATRELGFEVSAYRTQAELAKELGRDERGWNLGQADDGSVRSDDEILGALREEQLYRFDPVRRLMLGGAIGGAGVLAGGMAASRIATRVAPSSFLGRHAWPFYVAGGALLGAAMLQDQLAARD
jgi:hypothetical protein